MTEKNRNQEQTSDNQNMGNQDPDQNSQSQNSSNQAGEGQNPQDGSQWNNYRTRELSDQGSGEGNATTPRQTS